jgi:phosphinothricin acetyltransferase
MEYRLNWYEEHLSGNHPVFVAEEGGVVVGWISLSEYRKGRRALRYTSEVSFYIRKDRQGQRIGSEMLEFMIHEAQQIRIKTLIAILLGPNTASIRLLEKFGFRKWGDMPNVAEFDGVECNHLFYGLRIAH